MLIIVLVSMKRDLIRKVFQFKTSHTRAVNTLIYAKLFFLCCCWKEIDQLIGYLLLMSPLTMFCKIKWINSQFTTCNALLTKRLEIYAVILKIILKTLMILLEWLDPTVKTITSWNYNCSCRFSTTISVTQEWALFVI